MAMSQARKKARKAKMQAAKMQADIDRAHHLGFAGDVARMNRAGEVSTRNAGDRRKSIRHKVSDTKNIRVSSAITGKPVKGESYAPHGDFILYGARTKEGSLEMRKGYAHEPRAWKQGHERVLNQHNMSMHDRAGE